MTDQLEVATSQDIERNNDVDFSESSLAPNKKTHVYIKDGVKGWVPVKLIDVVGGKATVTCESHLPFALDERFRHAGKILLHNAGDPSDEETSLTSFTTASSLKSHPIEFAIDENSDDRITVRLKDYGGSLPLQYVDDDGNHQVVADLRDLPFIHEANVLYNIKARYEAPNEAIYTRLHHRIIIAINPNKWINGLYAEDTRLQYAEKLVWKGKKMGRGDCLGFITWPSHIFSHCSNSPTKSTLFVGSSYLRNIQSSLQRNDKERR